MRAQKSEKYKELREKRGTKEFDEWFLNYKPSADTNKTEKTSSKNAKTAKNNPKKKKTKRKTKKSGFAFF